MSISAPQVQNPMRVVLVEDSEIFRRHLSQLLRMLPHTRVVKEFSLQAEAQDWFRHHPEEWDLALVDLFLATGNGFGVLKSCAERSKTQKVVVVTNYVNDLVRTQVKAAGADAFFDKTLELDELADFCKAASLGHAQHS